MATTTATRTSTVGRRRPTRPPPGCRAGRHRRRPADDRARRDDREHRAAAHPEARCGFSATSLSWVLNAYTLTFGGLLLLGGRIGDILGRRRTFQIGIALFSRRLAAGWLLPELRRRCWRSVRCRASAVRSPRPTALALITTNFAEGEERNRAFGVFAAVSGSGAAIGLLLGGVLTQWASWRWVFFVNVPIGIAILPPRTAVHQRVRASPGKFDLAGAATSTAGHDRPGLRLHQRRPARLGQADHDRRPSSLPASCWSRSS